MFMRISIQMLTRLFSCANPQASVDHDCKLFSNHPRTIGAEPPLRNSLPISTERTPVARIPSADCCSDNGSLSDIDRTNIFGHGKEHAGVLYAEKASDHRTQPRVSALSINKSDQVTTNSNHATSTEPQNMVGFDDTYDAASMKFIT